jgi:hypothetical protein
MAGATLGEPPPERHHSPPNGTEDGADGETGAGGSGDRAEVEVPDPNLSAKACKTTGPLQNSAPTASDQTLGPPAGGSTRYGNPVCPTVIPIPVPKMIMSRIYVRASGVLLTHVPPS